MGASNSRRSGARWFTAAVIVLFAPCLASWGPGRAAADSGEIRPGCATYCQNAGGYGGSGHGTPPPPAVTLTTASVTADPDGYVPVTVACHLSTQCRGVLILSGGGLRARSDLLVGGGATQTIGIPLGPSAIGTLRSNGPIAFNVTIDANQAPGSDAQCGDRNEGCQITDDTNFSYILENNLTVAAPK